MRILIVTPAPRGSRAGNRRTAERWARILRSLGHRVHVGTGFDGHDAELLIALHAVRSADAVAAFRERRPEGSIVVALTGTDLYRDQARAPRLFRRSLALADRLVTLNEAAGEAVPKAFRAKLRCIHQSAAAAAPRRPAARRRRGFTVCVAGHLRREKDPLRAAYAARLLPATSCIRVVQIGRALDRRWAEAAAAETARNPRYGWRGELSPGAALRAIAASDLLVVSSHMEGGANVVGEAVALGTPILASDIPGNRGLLGAGYPGRFPPGDTKALARLLARAETDRCFLAALGRRLAARRRLFAPARERAAWRHLIGELRRKRAKSARARRSRVEHGR